MEERGSESLKPSTSSTIHVKIEDLELETKMRLLVEQAQALNENISSNAEETTKQCKEWLQCELEKQRAAIKLEVDHLKDEREQVQTTLLSLKREREETTKQCKKWLQYELEKHRAAIKLEVDHLKDEREQLQTLSLKRERAQESPQSAASKCTNLMKLVDDQLKEMCGKVDSVRKENVQLLVFLYTIMGLVLWVQAQFFNSLYAAKANVESSEARCCVATPTSLCSLLVFLCSSVLIMYTLLSMLHLKNTTSSYIRADIKALILKRKNVMKEMVKHGEDVWEPLRIEIYESNFWVGWVMVGFSLVVWAVFNVVIVQMPYTYLCSFN